METVNDFKQYYQLLGSDDYESRLLSIYLLKDSALRNYRVCVYGHTHCILWQICEDIIKQPEYYLRLSKYISLERKFDNYKTEELYKFLRNYVRSSML